MKKFGMIGVGNMGGAILRGMIASGYVAAEDVMACLHSEEKRQALAAKNSFLYIFEEPWVHRPGDTWKCPEKMYLAAIQEGKEVRAFEEGGRPWISAEHPHSQETLHLTRREEH